MLKRLLHGATVAAAASVIIHAQSAAPTQSAAGQTRTASASSTRVPSAPSSAKYKTPWGDPDIAGIFTTDDELGVPFERPEQFAGREFVTEEELAQRATQIQRQNDADLEEFIVPRAGAGGPEGGGGTGPPSHWLERGKPSRRTSVVVDPADGKIPYLNDAARQRSANAVNARTSGRRPVDGPEAMDLYDRCITRGFPHVIFPTIYNNTSQIVQGPGYVGIRYEMIHDVRVIPLEGGPHVSPRLRSYFGDSRGHWEGDTLVVDVTNFPTNTINYRGATGSLHVTERFRRIEAKTVRYEATVDDPATFSRPWTAAMSLKIDNRLAQVPEYACHEGNYAMTHILSGARADDGAAR